MSATALEYAAKHDTIHLLESMCTALLIEKPAEPISFLAQWLSHEAEKMTRLEVPPAPVAAPPAAALPPVPRMAAAAEEEEEVAAKPPPEEDVQEASPEVDAATPPQQSAVEQEGEAGSSAEASS